MGEFGWWNPMAWWHPMAFAPKDGTWIEAELEQGTAYAYWTGSYWDDGAGYVVEAKRWRHCDQSLPLPASRKAPAEGEVRPALPKQDPQP